MVNEGVRRAYLDPGQHAARLDRCDDPRRQRKNTKDNTPAVVHFDLVPGDTVDVRRRGEGRRLGEQGEVRDAESRPTRSSTGC